MVYIENVADMWSDLKEKYLQGYRVRVTNMYQNISNFKQEVVKVLEYFTEIHAREELD